MTNLVSVTPFSFGSAPVRVVEIDGEPWFVLRDVLQAMGSKTRTSNARTAIEEGSGDEYIKTVPLQTAGGMQETTIINESSLYSLILKSRNPSAKAVQRAILSQVGDSKAVLRALNDFEVPEDLPYLYVYAIRESETGRIKLGISRDPHARLRQLQTGSSQELELVAYRKAENRYQDEGAVHHANATLRIRGEWFEGSAVEIMQ